MGQQDASLRDGGPRILLRFANRFREIEVPVLLPCRFGKRLELAVRDGVQRNVDVRVGSDDDTDGGDQVAEVVAVEASDESVEVTE